MGGGTPIWHFCFLLSWPLQIRPFPGYNGAIMQEHDVERIGATLLQRQFYSFVDPFLPITEGAPSQGREIDCDSRPN